MGSYLSLLETVQIVKSVIRLSVAAFFTTTALVVAVASDAVAKDARYVVVVVDGIGDTPQSAMRNAAENGLKRVLGSYVDTEKTLTRRTEESNGTVTRKKEYEEKYREYSRGVLKDVERVSVELENGIYRAVAKVTVKVIE